MHKGKYSRYRAGGSDNPVWTNTVAMLSAVLNDETQSQEDKDQAAAILTWSIERAKTLEPDVAAFLNELDCGALWEWPDCFKLQDVVGKNGVTRRECVCVAPSLNIMPAKAATPPIEADSEEI